MKNELVEIPKSELRAYFRIMRESGYKTVSAFRAKAPFSDADERAVILTDGETYITVSRMPFTNRYFETGISATAAKAIIKSMQKSRKNPVGEDEIVDVNDLDENQFAIDERTTNAELSGLASEVRRDAAAEGVMFEGSLLERLKQIRNSMR